MDVRGKFSRGGPLKNKSCKRLGQLCPTAVAYWAKNYVTVSTRATHWIHINESQTL